jgi:hypothetical protein
MMTAVPVQEIGDGPALVLAAHYEDALYGCAGAMVRHAEAGHGVTVIVLGPGDPGAARAAAALGCPPPVCWSLSDEDLDPERLAPRLADELARHASALVYAPSAAETDPAHRALTRALVAAAPAGLRVAWYEIERPLRPDRLLDASAFAARRQAALDELKGDVRHLERAPALHRYRALGQPVRCTAAEAYRLGTARQLGEELDAAPPRDAEAPLVSVIVRTIGRQTLKDTLASIAVQTHGAVEVVLVKAAPVPFAVGERCGTFPVRTLGGDAPLARSRAANLGLQAARGRYVVFLDDDDWFHPHHLAALCRALADSPGARVAYSGIECLEIQPDGRQVKVRDFNEPFVYARLLCENFIPIHAALFERSLVEEGCAVDETLELYEDWDLWLQMAARTEFVHVPEIGGVYRYPGASALYEQADGVARDHQRAIVGKWRGSWTADHLLALIAAARAPHEAVAERDRLTQRLDEAAAAMRDRERECEEAWRAHGGLGRQMEALQIELEVVLEACREREQALRAADEAVVRALEVRDEAFAERDQAARERDAARREAAQKQELLTRERDEAREALHHTTLERDEARQLHHWTHLQRDQARQEHHLANVARDQAVAEREQLRHEREKLRLERDQARADAARAAQEIAERERERAELAGHLEWATAQLRALDAERGSTREALAEAQSELAVAEARLDEFYGSRTWRWSAAARLAWRLMGRP